jgi:ABC-type uncharacterized transport system YnjBCD ATPase subunit
MPHYAKVLDDMKMGDYDLVIALSPDAAGAARAKIMDVTGKKVNLEFWFMADPSTETGTRAQVMLAFRGMRDELERQIKRRFAYALPHIKPPK